MENPAAIERPPKILKIVKYANPILRAKGRQIAEVNSDIRHLAADMIETMRCARGLGLAAQQVGVALQITVIDVARVDQNERPSELIIAGESLALEDWMPIVLINPWIEAVTDEREVANEGCLSFPEIHGDISRASRVIVRANVLDRGDVEFEATGLLSRALQHEFDHLQGVLFIDRMSRAAKAGIAGRLKRLQRETEEG